MDSSRPVLSKTAGNNTTVPQKMASCHLEPQNPTPAETRLMRTGAEALKRSFSWGQEAFTVLLMKGAVFPYYFHIKTSLTSEQTEL